MLQLRTSRGTCLLRVLLWLRTYFFEHRLFFLCSLHTQIAVASLRCTVICSRNLLAWSDWLHCFICVRTTQTTYEPRAATYLDNPKRLFLHQNASLMLIILIILHAFPKWWKCVRRHSPAFGTAFRNTPETPTLRLDSRTAHAPGPFRSPCGFLDTPSFFSPLRKGPLIRGRDLMMSDISTIFNPPKAFHPTSPAQNCLDRLHVRLNRSFTRSLRHAVVTQAYPYEMCSEVQEVGLLRLNIGGPFPKLRWQVEVEMSGVSNLHFQPKK